MLGRSFDDPIVQESMKHLPYIVLCDGQNNVKLGIVHNDKKITITPVEICTMIFQNIKQTAEAFLGHVCKDAVVTVPSYFSHSQRSATKEAASRAGFNVLNITNEGIAAAMSYEFKEKWSGTKQVVVYDLGSESIDVSVLKLDKGNWKELATACDTSLGGRSFDDRLLEHLASEIQDKHRKDIYSCNQVLAEMRRVCEASKKNLTIYKSATINVELEFPDEVLNFRSTVSRETFDELNVDLFHVSFCLFLSQTLKSQVLYF